MRYLKKLILCRQVQLFVIVCMALVLLSFMFGSYIATRYKNTIMDYYSQLIVKVEGYYTIIVDTIENYLDIKIPIIIE